MEILTQSYLVPPVPPVYKNAKVKEPQCTFCGSLVGPFCRTNERTICSKAWDAKIAEAAINKAKNVRPD